MVLVDLDVAACAGLLQDSCPSKPAWLDDAWAADIRQIQARSAAAARLAVRRGRLHQALQLQSIWCWLPVRVCCRTPALPSPPCWPTGLQASMRSS